ncbi:ROK family transcriptional regulator [Phytoactinopolyspora halotolerans]|uniref:ROK family protein n=1 Tax=Phytoactinopolyspora halotolerans TaxID=1981512 RepID=A0A6L9S6F3_9ACTN|nr:ROK family transcriptional regulator [Phytoactinopolyspora halotolerans]NEE00736.1 ROK family protein [Phytoactinopolyspora halotolerans]
MHVAPPLWNGLTDTARSVALEVLYHGPLSRAELARRLTLSPGSLTRLSKPLIDIGVLTEIGIQPENRIGRPAVLLDVVPTSRHFLGIKLTGDEAHAVLTTLRAQVVARERTQLTSLDPATVVTTMRTLITNLGRRVDDVAALGVSFGGVSTDNLVVAEAPYLGWTDVPLAALLSEETGLPVVLENDVVAVTEAEHWFGAGRQCERFAVITIGVGTGYGLVVHNEFVANPDAAIGIIGHLPLDDAGPRCPLGHRGCAHAMLSIPGICASISVALGRDVGYDECLDLAVAGHPAARRIVDDAGRALGRLIALVANLTMPHKVILAGDGVRLAHIGYDAMQEQLLRDRAPRATPVNLDIQAFDFFEWARGAAVIAIQNYVLGRLPTP